MRVDLPAPFSPNKTCTSPRRASKFTPLKARTPGNRLTIPRIWRNGGDCSPFMSGPAADHFPHKLASECMRRWQAAIRARPNPPARSRVLEVIADHLQSAWRSSTLYADSLSELPLNKRSFVFPEFPTFRKVAHVGKYCKRPDHLWL